MPPPGSAATSVYEPEQLSREDREQQLHLGPSPAVFEGRVGHSAQLQVRTVSMAQARPRHLFPTRCGLK